MHLWHVRCTNGSIPGLDPKTWAEAFISKTEESALGISDKGTDQWRQVHKALNSEGIAHLAHSLPPSSDSSVEHDDTHNALASKGKNPITFRVPKKRGRSDTTTMSGSAQARVIQQK
jgi:hypothetical protein